MWAFTPSGTTGNCVVTASINDVTQIMMTPMGGTWSGSQAVWSAPAGVSTAFVRLGFACVNSGTSYRIFADDVTLTTL